MENEIKAEKSIRKKWWIWLIIAFILVVAVSMTIKYIEKQAGEKAIEELKATCLEKDMAEVCVNYVFDFDTQECLATPIIPCCGNDKCEIGERDTCDLDCKVKIIQKEKDTAFPVQFFKATNVFQSVVQLFTPPESDLELIEIAPYIDYSIGEGAYLIVYEIFDVQEPTKGKQLDFIILDFSELPRQDFYSILIDPPIKVSKDKNYSFLIYVEEETSTIGVGRISYKSVYDEGRAWYFSRLIGPHGEILDDQHAWRTYDDDLAFTLTFLRPEIE